MFEKYRNLWSDYGFEIILGLCFLFILLFALYRRITGKKGTWSTSYFYPSSYTTSSPRIRKIESKGEQECRRVLEETFNRPFPKARPNFLQNPVTGGSFNLELDCYNSDLNLAVEYNGAQHYKFTPYFHKNKEAFLNQKYRDDMKRRICKENGVILIEVPYTVSVDKIKEYLHKELLKNGVVKM